MGITRGIGLRVTKEGVRGKLKPASGVKRLNSQQMWIRKVQVSPYKVRYALFVVKPQLLCI